MKGVLLVRLGIVLIFIVFGIWEMLVPIYWAPFIPDFVASILNPLFATRVHGLVLVILGILTLIKYKTKIIAPLTSLTLLSVVFSVFVFRGFTDLLVRDFVIFICSLSLLFEREISKDKNL